MGEAMNLTPQQLHIIQHSLGLDQYGRGREYRNHFVTGPGSSDFADCESLVDGACMTVRRNLPLAGGDGSNCYTVTDWGRMKMHEQSPEPPKVPKSKLRYKAWLEVSDCYPDWGFGDWLKANQKRKRTGHSAA
jgi:hypothetical protein